MRDETVLSQEAMPRTFLPEEVLVVVPALNEERSIEACLHSLRASDPFMRGVQIVVADGGSSDETRAIVEDLAKVDPCLSLIDNPMRIQSAAVNRAVQQVARPCHQVLVRCDAHAIYPPGYVRRIVEVIAARPQVASVVSVMDAVGDEPFQRASAWVVDTPLGSGGAAHRGGTRSGWVDHGHHAGFVLDWFRRIGGYDESFSHNEDAEFDRRLLEAGGRIWLDASIRVDYKMRRTPRALMWQYWNYGRGRGRTVLKHRIRPRLRQVIPALNLFGMAAAGLLSPVFPVALTWPISYFLLLLGVSIFAAISSRDLTGLWAGVVLAIAHNAWGAGFLRTMASADAWRSGRRQSAGNFG
ncbi:glycosyltransferase family 2 protein [Salipiger sp. CCB-MM3]|uniref:glycosyltransferase family 2 protein n=1 Tax=Salipiger sp. CCB-MM3 TaxID=1792508 RepID=UPI0008271719|nr:glycosyltransferase family 2 protein [Salipiger sp. CCB-MM3]